MITKSDQDDSCDGMILRQKVEEEPKPKPRGLEDDPPEDDSPGGG